MFFAELRSCRLLSLIQTNLIRNQQISILYGHKGRHILYPAQCKTDLNNTILHRPDLELIESFATNYNFQNSLIQFRLYCNNHRSSLNNKLVYQSSSVHKVDNYFKQTQRFASTSTKPQRQLPSSEQLYNIVQILEKGLPQMYTRSMDYTIFKHDAVLVNNITGSTKRGLIHIVLFFSGMKLKGHLRFSFVQLRITHICPDFESGSVKVHWQRNGVTLFNFLKNVIRTRMWTSINELLSTMTIHKKDGLFIYVVGEDGAVHTLIVDDKAYICDGETKKKTNDVAEKVASAASTITQTKSKNDVLIHHNTAVGNYKYFKWKKTKTFI